MGIKLTHAPEEMLELKNLTLNKQFVKSDGEIKKMKILNKFI